MRRQYNKYYAYLTRKSLSGRRTIGLWDKWIGKNGRGIIGLVDNWMKKSGLLDYWKTGLLEKERRIIGLLDEWSNGRGITGLVDNWNTGKPTIPRKKLVNNWLKTLLPINPPIHQSTNPKERRIIGLVDSWMKKSGLLDYWKTGLLGRERGITGLLDKWNIGKNTNPLIHQSTYPPIPQSTYPPIPLSTNPPIHQSNNPTIHFIQPKAGLSIYPLFTMLLISLFWSPDSSAESLCAEVQISIRQEVAFERQAFEAHMRINNGGGVPITDISVDVEFTDEEGNEVTASSDKEATDSSIKFFINVDDDQTNVAVVAGDAGAASVASVGEGTSADIYWLIIPTADESNVSPTGKLYYVGATLSYKIGGVENQTKVTPDFIYVKPTPILKLDYFLPQVGEGDDPNTKKIEATEPFYLGLRVRNDGYGPANKFTIESAQPKIVANELGLLIGFTIIGSEVNGATAQNTLKVDFGDVQPLSVNCARWVMETSLSGTFKDFKAEYTHSDALGGQLTSLIDELNTHTLVRDVLVDEAGRDKIRDFLASDNGVYSLYDSENPDPEAVNDLSGVATLTRVGSNASEETWRLVASTVAQPGHVFVKLADPYAGAKTVKRAIRQDGKTIRPENVWIAKKADGEGEWLYSLCLYDAATPGTYDIVFDAPENLPQAPTMQYIADKSVSPGTQCSFIVEASDPNDDPVTITCPNLPSGAQFYFSEVDDGLYIYIFDWTPTPDQIGAHAVTFTASDGSLTYSRTPTITVGSGGYALTVVSGSGGGNYPPDEIVTITADPASDGQEFDQWTGDAATLALVTDVSSATTTIAMPSNAATVTATYRTATISDPLVLHWPLDESQGPLVEDVAGYEFNGTLSGGSAWTASGVVDDAVELDGTDGEVTSNFAMNLASWTVAAWVKGADVPSATDHITVIDRGDNFQINWGDPDAGNAIAVARVRIGGTWYSSGLGALDADKWYHLAATFDGETLKTYLNGALCDHNDNPSGSADSSSTTLSLGTSAGADAFFAGSVDDLRIYQTVLAQADLKTIVDDAKGIRPTPDPYEVDEDQTLAKTATEGVLSNDTSDLAIPLTAAVVSQPSNGTLTLDADGSFTYVPNADFNGTDSFSYKANDGRFDSDEIIVAITVNPVNDAPVAAADVYAATEDSTLSVVVVSGVLANDADVDNDSLSASLENDVSHGTLSFNNDGSFTYVPNADFNGTDSFTYKVSDGTASSAETTVTLNVSPVNDAPVAVDDSFNVVEDNTLAGDAAANDFDVDLDVLTAILVSQASHGTASLNADGTFTYTPNLNFNGTDSFTYKLNDGTTDSAVATVSISVSAVNDAPDAVDDAYTADEDLLLSVSALSGVLFNDSDPESDAMTAELVSDVANGVLTFSSDGAFTYMPNLDFEGTDSFTYRVTDGLEYSNVATVSIAINPTANAALALTADPAEGAVVSCDCANYPVLDVGQQYNVTAAPAMDYVFIRWIAADGATVGDIYSASTTLTMTADGSLTAKCAMRTESAVLTTAVSPAEAGTASPSTALNVECGEAFAITATAASAQYSFNRWRVSGNAVVADATADSTTVTLNGDATLTAVFVDTLNGGYFPVDFKLVSITINDDEAPAQESDDINIASEIFNSDMIASADIGTDTDFSFVVRLDDFELELDETNGSLTRRSDTVFTYQSNDAKVRLKLKIGLSGYWTLRVRDAALNDLIDHVDGLGVSLVLGDKIFGNHLDVDHEIKWMFDNSSDGSVDLPLLPGEGTPMTTFDIVVGEGETVSQRQAWNYCKIQEALCDPFSDYDPDVDSISVAIDDWKLVIVDGELSRSRSVVSKAPRMKMRKNKLTLRNARGSTDFKYRMKMNFDTGEWQFRCANVELLENYVYPRDGIDVRLGIRDKAAAKRLTTTRRIRLKYPKR